MKKIRNKLPLFAFNPRYILDRCDPSVLPIFPIYAGTQYDWAIYQDRQLIVTGQYLQWVNTGGGGEESISKQPITSPATLPKSVFLGKTPFERFISAQGVGFQLSIVNGLGLAVIGGGIGTLAGGPPGQGVGGLIGFCVGVVGSEVGIFVISFQDPGIVLEPPPPGVGQFRYQTTQLDQPGQQQNNTSGRK